MTALNKVDRLAHRDGAPVTGLDDLAGLDLTSPLDAPDAVLISAARGWGLDSLRSRLERRLAEHAPAAPAPARDAWPARRVESSIGV